MVVEGVVGGVAVVVIGADDVVVEASVDVDGISVVLVLVVFLSN